MSSFNQGQQSATSVRVGAPGGGPKAKPGANTFTGKLGLAGLVSIVTGLVICGSFFLPWFSSQLVCTDPVCTTAFPKDPKFLSYATSPTGISIASGTFTLTTAGASGPIREGFGFVLLWVVFLAGLALILLPPLLAAGRMDVRRTRIFLLVFSLLTLVVEIGYAMSAAQALPQTRASLAVRLNGLTAPSGRLAIFDFSTGPGLGFWLALGATLVATAATVYALYAATMTRPFDAGVFWGNLGLAGQLTLVAGLALCVLFFLPWFATPDPSTGNGGYKVALATHTVTVAQTVTTSGWNTAAGGLQTPLLANGSCATCLPPHINIFPLLWLVPVTALSLVALTWLLGRGLLWRRMAAILACVTLLVALAVEGFFLLEVQSLQNYDEQIFQAAGQQLTSTAYGVTWGFWASLAVTGVALLLSGFLLLQRHKSVTGMPKRP